MKRFRGILVAAGVLALVAAIYFMLTLFHKEPDHAIDFTVGAHTGQVLRLSDNYGKRGSIVMFIDPGIEGSNALMERIAQRADGAFFFALSVSGLPEEEQLALLPESVRGLEGLCFECSDAVEKYNVGHAPLTYFIDKDGIVREAYVGAMRDSSIEKCVKMIGGNNG